MRSAFIVLGLALAMATAHSWQLTVKPVEDVATRPELMEFVVT